MLMKLTLLTALAATTLVQQPQNDRGRLGNFPREHSTTHDYDADLLNQLCQSKEANDGYLAAQAFIITCRSYLQGAIRGLEAGDAFSHQRKNFSHLDESKRTLLCIPYGVPLDELVDFAIGSLKQYLDTYPEEKTLPAMGIIASVLVIGYPCR
jgi:hypothetical protein